MSSQNLQLPQQWQMRLHRWHTRLQPEAGWRAHGPWGLAAAALAVAAGLAGVAQPGWQAQALADEGETLRLMQQASQRAARYARQTQWTDKLPDTRQHETRLADLMEGALRHGVAVAAVDQGSPSTPVPGLRLQRIDISARAPYADLRRYIETALQADPGLALQRVTLSRAQGEAVELDARLQFSLLQRVAGPVGTAGSAVVTLGRAP